MYVHGVLMITRVTYDPRPIAHYRLIIIIIGSMNGCCGQDQVTHTPEVPIIYQIGITYTQIKPTNEMQLVQERERTFIIS